ncbi:hypothetical protein [Clostridium sp. CF012]|nr:hypothetical protein [Clostridium sp. CF012]MBU3147016.1 hypothetical protein [Clostridium sp. CF012]
MCKGEKLNYLLNLSEIEKIFYKESMAREQEEYVDFEIQKLQALQSMFKM